MVYQETECGSYGLCHAHLFFEFVVIYVIHHSCTFRSHLCIYTADTMTPDCKRNLTKSLTKKVISLFMVSIERFIAVAKEHQSNWPIFAYFSRKL